MTAHLAQIELNWSEWITPFTWAWKEETACSVLVGIACGVLGCFVVLRRMALIGDALSHAVLPGVVIAFLITQSTGIAGLFLGALIAGLVTAGLIKLVSQYSRAKEDSAIGIVFTALFALGIVLISAMPRGTHFDLKCFLFGDPLAVGNDDLIMMAIICPLVVLLVTLLYHRLKIISFDPVVAAAMGISVSAMHYLLMGMLSATVVAGLKTTGVILVVAMVITPAAAAYQFANRLWAMLILAAVFGAASAAAGMSVAFITNSPTGPAMVLVATMIFALAMIVSPEYGLVFRLMRRRRVRRHIDGEDVLKALYHWSVPARAPTVADLVTQTRLSSLRVGAAVRELTGEQAITYRDGAVQLSATGRRRAEGLVRAHRLWESYLAEQAGLDMADIHDAAERLEHAHELADEVDAKLGFPAVDPHGEVIPGREARPSHISEP
jgi:ABC-type Mn2+/Zn2+ transport system permease subunit/Mn-dependent DtxR family transcriptional regulator